MSPTDRCQYCAYTVAEGHAANCEYGKPFSAGPIAGQARAVNAQGINLSNPPRLTTDSAARKRIAVYSGLLRYFPDALAYVAQISWAGNEKHNPGQAMHWNRAKSGDELDCVARHLLEIGTIDPDDGFWHDGKLAWRALANLQKHLEKVNNLPISPGSK